MADLCDGGPLRWRTFVMGDLCDGRPLRWGTFAMVDRPQYCISINIMEISCDFVHTIILPNCKACQKVFCVSIANI